MSPNTPEPAALPRQILVAVDAEGLADHAIHAGLDLARRFDARLELLHAVGTPALDWEIAEDARSAAAHAGILTTAWRAMNAHVGKLLAARNGVALRTEDLIRILPGRPAKVILDRAAELDADLIVLGTHRRRGLADFGSTVRAVLASAPKGVWIQPRAFAPITSILVPIDLSPDSLRALSTACVLAGALGAKLRVVHCFQSANYLVSAWPEYPDFGTAYALDEVRAASEKAFLEELARFDWRGVPHESEFLDGEPAEQILQASGSADLVVMGTHGRTGLASVLLGNVAYKVLKRSDTPVLALRHPERAFSS